MATTANLSEALAKFYPHIRGASVETAPQPSPDFAPDSMLYRFGPPHSAETWREIYRCPQPGEIDLLVLEQACRTVMIGLECEVASCADQMEIDSDILYTIVVDRLATGMLGVSATPPSTFVEDRKNENNVLTTKQLANRLRSREKVIEARLEGILHIGETWRPKVGVMLAEIRSRKSLNFVSEDNSGGLAMPETCDKLTKQITKAPKNVHGLM
jgi:hypothetical protein